MEHRDRPEGRPHPWGWERPVRRVGARDKLGPVAKGGEMGEAHAGPRHRAPAIFGGAARAASGRNRGHGGA